jgi:hypothetical protein
MLTGSHVAPANDIIHLSFETTPADAQWQEAERHDDREEVSKRYIA